MKIQAIVVSDEYTLPEYATAGAAAMDLHVYPEKGKELLPNGQTKKFRTGLKLHIGDANVVAVIVPRSGLGTKDGIVLANGTGVIDSDYQGEIFVTLRNMGAVSKYIEKGDRVAQMLFMPVARVEFEQVEEFEEETVRGEGGHGSTGVKKKAVKKKAA